MKTTSTTTLRPVCKHPKKKLTESEQRRLLLSACRASIRNNKKPAISVPDVLARARRARQAGVNKASQTRKRKPARIKSGQSLAEGTMPTFVKESKPKGTDSISYKVWLENMSTLKAASKKRKPRRSNRKVRCPAPNDVNGAISVPMVDVLHFERTVEKEMQCLRS